MNGPVAMAGSTFIFFSNNGINVPRTVANTITESKATLTDNVSAKLSEKKKLYAKIKPPHISQLHVPIRNSLNNFLPVECMSRSPLARPCTTIADDCTPAFPPIAAISGKNIASEVYDAISSSKTPIICDDNTPPSIPISNQGMRDFVCLNTLSEKLTSFVIPALNW